MHNIYIYAVVYVTLSDVSDKADMIRYYDYFPSYYKLLILLLLYDVSYYLMYIKRILENSLGWISCQIHSLTHCIFHGIFKYKTIVEERMLHLAVINVAFFFVENYALFVCIINF